jgi:DNA-binding NtrC family response regulator
LDIFIKCRKCEHQNQIVGIPATRVDLAMLRGSEDPIKCKNCGAEMDTMTAYYGSAPSGQGVGDELGYPPSKAGGSLLAEQERELIIRALQATRGNVSGAARLLRISRDELRYKVTKHNLG